MAFDLKKFIKGIIIDSLTYDSALHDKEGAVFIDSADDKLKVRAGSAQRRVVTHDQTETLTNKTIDADGTGNSITNLEDANIKAGAAIDAEKLADGSVSNTELQYINSVTSNVQDQIDSKSSSTDLTNHEADTSTHGVGEIVGTSEAQTLTNKTIDADSSTITNIGDEELKAGIDAAKLADGSISNAELQYINSLSSNAQDQIDGKEAADATILKEADIIDTLISTSTTDPLSANQGKVLKDSQDTIASDLSTHESETTTHGVSGDVVGTTSTQTLTNKDIDGGTASNTSRITLPKNTKANLDALTRKEGTVLAASDEDKLYYDTGASLVEIGSGAGGRVNNYYEGLNAEDNSVADWSNSNARFAPAISGSGLRDTKSYNLVASSALVGDTIDLPTFQLDGPDIAAIVTVVADVFTGADFDDDCIEFVLVQNGVVVKSLHDQGLVKAGQKKLIAQFQTLPSGTPCLLRAVIKSNVTTNLLMDNIELKNQDFLVGGGNTEVVFKAHLGSNQNTSSTGASIVPLDASTIDSNGCFDLANNAFKAKETGYYFASGFVAMAALSAGTFFQAEIRIDGVVKLRGNRNEPSVPASRSLASGLLYVEKDQLVELYLDQNESASETIQGGEVNTQLSLFKIGGSGSSSIGGEILSEIDYRGNGGQSITANVTDITFTTANNPDKLGEWDGSGFVAKTTKTYIFSGVALFTTALNADLNSYIDTVFDRTVNTAHGIAEQGKNFICIVKLQAGERWSLRSGASGTLSNNSNVHYINVNALAETSNGIAPEQVKLNEKARNTLGQSIGSGSGGSATLVWDTAEHSSHGALNLSTGVFTAPYSGYFNFSGQFIWNGDAAFTAGRLTWAYFRKDGISKTFQGFKEIQSSDAGTIFVTVQFDEDIYLEKDQTLEIAPYQNTGANRDIVANGEYNVLQIKDA